MKSKFIIFLVFASLAQSCYGSTLKVSYGLSENEVVILEKIINNREASEIASSDAYETLFDILIEGLETKTHNHCYKVSKVFAKVKEGVNLFLNSIKLLLGDSSSADVEAVRDMSCFYLDRVSDQMTRALKLAKFGHYSKNQAAIENSQAAVLIDFTDLREIVWHLIYAYPNYQDADIQAVIESAANKSLAGLNHANNAFFNAIKLSAGAVDANCGQYKTLKSHIGELRGKALTGLKYDIANQYSVLGALYISSRLNLTGLLADLTAIQYAQILAQATYTQGNALLLDTIKRYVTRILYNLSDDGTVDSPRDYDNLQRFITIANRADHFALDSFLTLWPETASAISSASDRLGAVNTALNPAFYNAVYSAYAVTSGNYSETIEEIETFRNEAGDPAPGYTDTYFDIIRNNKTFDDEIEAELVRFQNLSTYGALVTTYQFLDGALLLANASYTYDVNDETFSAIETFLAVANDGVRYFTQGMAAASTLVIRVS